VKIRIIQCSCAALLTVSSAYAGGVSFVDNFENYRLTGYWPSKGGAKIVNDPRWGNYAVEMALQGGGDNRTEKTIASPRIELGKTYTMTFSNKLDNSWNFEYGAIVFNVHKRPDAGDVTGKQPFHLRVRDGKWHLQTTWDDNAKSTRSSISRKSFSGGTAQRGKWYDWKVRYKPSYKGDGLLEVWRDGNKIVNYRGPTYFNDKEGGFVKYGIYSPEGGKSGQKIYYDGVSLRQGG